MKLSELSVKRPVTVLMLIFIVILIGMVSFSRLGLDLYPKIDIPVAVVMTEYEGAGPNEIENLLTRPLEAALSTVTGVSNIRSISSEGESIVIVEFEFNIKMDDATLEMRENIARMEAYLPDEATKPNVFKIDPTALPIMIMAISSTDGQISKNVIEDKIIPRLERLDGVARVATSGLLDNEVSVRFDEVALKNYNLGYFEVSQMIVAENNNIAAGKIDRGKRTMPLRVIGEMQSIDDIAKLPIALPTGGRIKLADIATVKLKAEDKDLKISLNGKEAIGISILKTTDANTANVADRIFAELDKIKAENKSIEISMVQDNSRFIKNSVSSVARSGLMGGLLAITILFIFFRNVRSTFIIAISIPVSVIGTFALIYFAGITMNLMTLGGLSLGMGMLVDNSIVVLENIFRYRELGYDKKEAAIKGANEVSMAVVASTLTTVAVFLPVIFVEGVTSLLFRELASTITFSIVSSLIIALTVVPMLSSQLLNVKLKQQRQKTDILKKIGSRFMTIYAKLINFALVHRIITISFAVAVFVVSVLMVTSLGAEFIPAMDEGVIAINISLPDSSKFEQTLELTEKLESIIVDIEEIDSVYTMIGSSGTSLVSTEDAAKAAMMISLIPLKERERTVFEISDEIRTLYKNVAGAEIDIKTIQSQDFSAGGMPISIEISGDNLDILKKYGDKFVDIVNSVEGTREVSHSIEDGIDELVVKVDREKALDYGLSAAQISQMIKQIISGSSLTAYAKDGEEMTIVLEGLDQYKLSADNFKNYLLQTPKGKVALSVLLSDIYIAAAPVQIDRSAQSRIVTVSADIFGRDLSSVSNDIKTKLEAVKMPEGYSYKLGGETEQLRESFSSLVLALFMAVALVYMIMASQFENLLYPLIIMFTVPLAFSGSVFGLKIVGSPVGVTALIGMIMLAGIVVNNAIVLIDYINTLRKRGALLMDAVLEAATTRLRPILMTTLTTILGLLPMALGNQEGSEMTVALSAVVIGGLLLSTLLTLVVIPTVYLLFNYRELKQGL